MISSDAKTDAALRKLLRLAKQKTEETSARLVDLNAACAATRDAIDALAASVRREEASAKADAVGLVAYFQAASLRRATLQATQDLLVRQIDGAREDLRDCAAESQKLEHLLGVAMRHTQRRQTRDAAAALDDAGRRRGRLGAAS